MLKDKTKENDSLKLDVKKASDAVKSLQKKLAESTSLLLNKDNQIHKWER
jgi:hypothetical protein